jgi:macrolide-specific efflux system membrane fusion protein
MKLKLFAVLLLAVVGVGAVIYTLSGISIGKASSTEYLTTPAAVGDVTDEVAATGTIESEARYGAVFGADPYLVDGDATAPTVTATYPVTEVQVEVGDLVKKGDVIATADTTDLRTKLTVAQNSLLSAKVNVRIADSAREDADDSDSTDQIRQAQINQYNAQNQLAEAQQQVDDLRAQIKGATLLAPIDGLLTEVNIQAGFDAPSGPAVVVDSTTFQITTDVVESDLADIAVGQEAAVTISAVDADVTGTVSAISPVPADSSSGSGSVVSYPVTVTLADTPDEARSGMSADVTITVASATDVLTVPASALHGSNGDYSVLTMAADGTVTTTAVEVGLVTNTTAEIKSGLTEGQAVVTGTASDQTASNSSGGLGFPGGGGGVVRGGGGGDNGPVFETKP